MRCRQLCSCNMRSVDRGSVAILVATLFVSACSGDAAPARVTIPAGASMRAAAESLSLGGVIRFPALFSAYAKVRSSDRDIKAGTYLLAKTASWNTVLGAL